MSKVEKKKRGRKPKGLINNDDKNYKTESETLVFHLPIKVKKSSSDIFIKSKPIIDDLNVKNLKNEIQILKDKNKKLQSELIKIKPTDKKIINYYSTKYDQNTKCWWCKHCFTTPAIGLPENYVDYKFELQGNFCSFNCAKSYNMDLSDNNTWKRNSLLSYFYNLTYNEDKVILQAPHWKTLKDFGGNLTIEQFRDDAIINSKEYIYLHPPLVTRKPLIEEVNRNKVSVIDNKELILKRSKPLKSNIHNIRKILGIID